MIDTQDALRRIDDKIDALMTGPSDIVTGDPSRWEEMRTEVFGTVVVALWDYLMGACGGYRKDSGLLPAEKALAELMRRGLRKDGIHFESPTLIWFSTGRLRYRITKSYRCFEIWPLCAGSRRGYDRPIRWIALDRTEFADFIHEFDALVPEISSRIDGAFWTLKMKQMQEDIIRETVSSLAAGTLTPAGITCTVSGFHDGYVTLSCRRDGKLPLTLRSTPDEIARTMEGVPELMDRQPDFRKQDTEQSWWRSKRCFI